MHEVEFAEKQISGCEDKILELMIGLESEEKALKVAEAELKTEVCRRGERKSRSARAYRRRRKASGWLKGKRARACAPAWITALWPIMTA